MPKQTMTGAMLDWAIAHHEATHETDFPVEARFRRAAAQHYQGVWGFGGYWIHLSPPSIHAPLHAGQYRITMEVDDGGAWSDAG